MENIVQTLIYIHAILGGIALIAGAIALMVKKGLSTHKKAGKVFFYTMLISAFTALIIAVLPQHENPFLFSIGVFSAYFLISGYRSLNFKQKDFQLNTDKIIAYLIIFTGLSMLLYPLVFYGKLNVVLSVFGIVGLVFGVRDLMLFRQVEALRKKWLPLHLGKMAGGYIAAITAFFVVNNILPGLLNWFAPGIIGGFYIAYWIRKVG